MKPAVIAKGKIESWGLLLIGLIMGSFFLIILGVFVYFFGRLERVGASEQGIFSGKLFGYDFFDWSKIKEIKFNFGGKFWTLKIFMEGRKQPMVLSEERFSRFYSVCRLIAVGLPNIGGHENFPKILTEEREQAYLNRANPGKWIDIVCVTLAIVCKIVIIFLK